MSNLPNSDSDKIKVYANEYITNSTINRPNLRLLQNDLFLENALSGYDPSEFITLSTQVDSNTTDITTNAADIATNASNISDNETDIVTVSGDVIAVSAAVDNLDLSNTVSGFSSVKMSLNADQTITSLTTGIIDFQQPGWDDNSEWDAGNNRFVFNSPGTTGAKFSIDCYIYVDVNAWTVTESKNSFLAVYKNGAIYEILKRGENLATTAAIGQPFQGSTIIELDHGDYFDIRFYNADTTSSVNLYYSTRGTKEFYVGINRLK